MPRQSSPLRTVLSGSVAFGAKVLVSSNPAVFCAASATRTSSAIQFTSQVFPPSSENAGASEPERPGDRGRHTYNDLLRRRYDGPCPPEGPAHKYHFTLFALDLPSVDDAGTPMTWRKLRAIIKGHVLGQTSLTGLRGH